MTSAERTSAGIAGTVVAITGAGSGVGEAIAVLLAGRGARVVLGGRRADRLDAVVARITDAGGEAVRLVTDVRRRADVEALVALARERHGRLDVMVNNAGVGLLSPMDELRVQDWEEMVDVNVKGTLYGIAAALPGFRAQGSGHVVNTLSTAGLKIVPTMAVYAGTKNAVRTISEALRQEAGPDLRVTLVSPGMIRTDFAGPGADPELASRIAEIAIPPEAVARAVAFAIEQPAEVDVGEIVVRPTAQA